MPVLRKKILQIAQNTAPFQILNHKQIQCKCKKRERFHVEISDLNWQWKHVLMIQIFFQQSADENCHPRSHWWTINNLNLKIYPKLESSSFQFSLFWVWWPANWKKNCEYLLKRKDFNSNIWHLCPMLLWKDRIFVVKNSGIPCPTLSHLNIKLEQSKNENSACRKSAQVCKIWGSIYCFSADFSIWWTCVFVWRWVKVSQVTWAWLCSMEGVFIVPYSTACLYLMLGQS